MHETTLDLRTEARASLGQWLADLMTSPEPAAALRYAEQARRLAGKLHEYTGSPDALAAAYRLRSAATELAYLAGGPPDREREPRTRIVRGFLHGALVAVERWDGKAGAA